MNISETKEQTQIFEVMTSYACDLRHWSELLEERGEHRRELRRALNAAYDDPRAVRDLPPLIKKIEDEMTIYIGNIQVIVNKINEFK